MLIITTTGMPCYDKHGEDMRRWDGKSTSVLAAQVCKLKEETINRGSSTRMNLAPISCDRATRYNRREDDVSDPLEGTSRMYDQRGNNSQN